MKSKVLCAAAGVAVAAVIAGVIAIMALADKRANDRERELLERINVACDGRPPRDIERHNSSWSHGGWTEVICPDGSRRALR